MGKVIDEVPKVVDGGSGDHGGLLPLYGGCKEVLGGHFCQLRSGQSDRRKQIIEVRFGAGGGMMARHGDLLKVFAVRWLDVVCSGGRQVNLAVDGLTRDWPLVKRLGSKP